jgi:hypothetical protein
MSANVTMPNTCRCGSLKAHITDGELVCAQCSAKRNAVSDLTVQFLASVTELFGEPTSAVVLRTPRALKAISEQDEFLRRKRTPYGETWFDIITDNLGPAPVAGPDDDIAHEPIDAGWDNDNSFSVEESD